MHHLIRTFAVRSVDELVHVTHFNGRILIDFVTQSNECPVLIVTTGNKARIVINGCHGNKQLALNDEA